ncbi:hypothetical protein [Streptomyces sp. NPDC005438]|uniref:hypothetical protein n=1 Tax=Streptomyces sp. NPDC005438 TaxID=3156880 RepID=UPI0033AA7735
MNPGTRLRTSSALWAAPIVLGLSVFYAVHVFGLDYPYSRSALPYAPEVVSFALEPFYGLGFAVVAALSAWEAGRLGKDGVWELAPVRSRYRVAFQALWPVLVLGWLMLLVAVGAALVREGVAPTLDALQFPCLAALLDVAYCVIGFAVGLWVTRLIAAPLLAVGVFYLVAFAGAGQFSEGGADWTRHLSGSPSGFLSYGELATWSSLAAHLLPAAGVAAGLALAWGPGRTGLVRATAVVAACAVAVGAFATAYRLAADWGATAPVARARVLVDCAGEAPRVCVPRESDLAPAEARRVVTEVVTALREAGAGPRTPRRVTDSLVDDSHRITDGEWHLPLTEADRDGALRYRVYRTAGRLPCAKPRPADASALRLWQAHQVGEERRYLRALRGEVIDPGGDRELAALQKAEDARVGGVKARVAKVLEWSDTRQRSWYRATLDRVCGGGAR